MARYSTSSLAAAASWFLKLAVPFQALGSPTPVDAKLNTNNPRTGNPLTVNLGYASYTGYTDATTGLNNFRGMQYAAPPVENLRWQKPQPPPTQTATVTLTTDFPPACPQSPQAPFTPSSSWYGNEDCLYLSVIAPPDAQDLPVLIVIHGGGYGGGAGNADYSEMIANNGNGFIYVAIQYRLGAFGFLSAAAMSGRGTANAGLWDQHAALLWVHNHISSFGGDPSRVTIMGESAGGGSVMTLVLGQDGAWGTSLFQNAIAASPYLPQQYDYNGPFSESTFAAFAVAAGCLDESAPADNATVFACLQAADTTTLQNANQQVNSVGKYGTWAFLPVTDGDYLRHLPSDQLLKGLVNGARILTGNNANEGPSFVTPTITDAQDFDNWVTSVFPLMGQDELNNVAETYAIAPVTANAPLFATLGDSGPNALNQSSFAVGYQQSAINLYAETTFVCPSYWLASSFGRPVMGGQAWHYQFSVPPSEHGADLDAYYSATAISPGTGTMTDEFRLGVQLIMGNFIINNDPTLSTDTIAQLAGTNGVNGAFEAAGSDKWSTWSGGAGGSSMLNLNMTGGVEVQVQMNYAQSSVTVTQYTEPGLSAAWALVDGYSWEGGRGSRCDAWASVGPTVPEK